MYTYYMPNWFFRKRMVEIEYYVVFFPSQYGERINSDQHLFSPDTCRAVKPGTSSRARNINRIGKSQF